MKRMILIVSLLVLLSLACATLMGGGNDTNTSGTEEDNQPANAPAGEPNTQQEDEQPAEEPPVDASAPDTVCYNPYYPLAAGGAYTYQLGYADPMSENPEDMEIAEFQIVTVAETDDLLIVKTVFDDFSSEVEWVCGEEGLFSTEFAQFDFTEFVEIEIETISYEGITLPAEELWFVGSIWDMDYEIEMTYSIEGLEITSHAIGDLVNEITAIEPVTVPAGTYSVAYRVETAGTITMETDTGMGAVSLDVPMEMVTWYVKGVGMVRQETSDESGNSLIELIEVE